MRRLYLTAIALVGFALAGCASQTPRSGKVPSTTDALQRPDAVVALSDRAEYRIGPNDLLTVTVFQVKDLDREVRVNNAGDISLPLIGTVKAAGRGVHELERLLEARYGARYLQNPRVTVFVKEAVSQRVSVEGAVANPGIFPMTTRISLLQAVALARGPTNVANERNVVIFRTVEGEKRFARFDLKAIRNGELADPEVFGEDIVVVDESEGKVWLRRVIEFTPLIGVWSVFR